MSAIASVPDAPRSRPSADESGAALRILMACAVVAYVLVRFGAAAGQPVLAAGLGFVLLEAAQRTLPGRWARVALITLQFGLVFTVAFAPAPIGFRSVIPGPVMMESPLFMLMLCVLATYALSVDPLLMAGASFALAGAWTAAIFAFVVADPLTITRANLHVADYKTGLELMRAVNQPHYLHLDFWRADLIAAGVVSLVLCFSAFRVRRLARRSAWQEAARNALSAHFSPQIAALLASLPQGLAPETRRVAVLDCDLVGFSGQAERLPPEAVAETLRHFRALVAAAVFQHDGAILNVVGDGAVAVFGLTSTAKPSVGAALAAAGALAEAWRTRPPPVPGLALPALAMGVDFGEALVGIVGEGRALSLIMQGPPIDGAAELQRATRAAGESLLVSDRARAMLGPPVSDNG